MDRKALEALLTETAEPIAAARGVELVAVEYLRERGGAVARFYIDKPGGVTLDDCQAVSEALSERLDAIDPLPGPYRLEVSSPGIDRPLVKEEDFVRFRGRRVRLSTYGPYQGRRHWSGVLLGLEEGSVVLQLEGEQRVRIPLQQLAKARLDG